MSFPTRPVLTIQESATQVDIAQSAAFGCEKLGRDLDFGSAKLLNWSATEARAHMRRALRAGREGKGRAEVFSALATDAAVAHGKVIATPLDLLKGQGHQYFLERLSGAPRLISLRKSKKRRKRDVRTPAQTVALALFHPWRRIDRVPSFRWDPSEDRRYALRASNPAKSAILTVAGANSLAAVGLPILTLVPVSVHGRVGVRTVGVRRADGQTQLTWPIWTEPASIAEIRALLTHPGLADERGHGSQLRSLGVHELRRTTRIHVGQYVNFTEAEAVSIG
jgi:hypothetical protein